MVDLPSTVTSIGKSAFNNDTALKTVICRSTTPPTLKATAFVSTVENIYVPDANVNAYKAATNWSTYADKIKGISEMQ